jgi:hypothetical protein
LPARSAVALTVAAHSPAAAVVSAVRAPVLGEVALIGLALADGGILGLIAGRRMDGAADAAEPEQRERADRQTPRQIHDDSLVRPHAAARRRRIKRWTNRESARKRGARPVACQRRKHLFARGTARRFMYLGGP